MFRPVRSSFRNNPPTVRSNLHMKNTLLAVLFGAALLVSGCSTLQKSDTAALQGTWKGYHQGHQSEGTSSVTFCRNTLEFHGPETDNWCKGIFSLREDTNPKQLVGTILECLDPKVIGETVHAIYRINGGQLTLAGNPPGNPDVPTSFDAPGVRTLVLKRP
jgi:uncharacterized protein (TIGR03067 family)